MHSNTKREGMRGWQKKRKMEINLKKNKKNRNKFEKNKNQVKII